MIPLLAGKAAAGPLTRLLILLAIGAAVIWVAPDLIDVAISAAGDAAGATFDAVMGAVKGIIDWFVGLVADKLNPF